MILACFSSTWWSSYIYFGFITCWEKKVKKKFKNKKMAPKFKFSGLLLVLFLLIPLIQGSYFIFIDSFIISLLW